MTKLVQKKYYGKAVSLLFAGWISLVVMMVSVVVSNMNTAAEIAKEAQIQELNPAIHQASISSIPEQVVSEKEKSITATY